MKEQNAAETIILAYFKLSRAGKCEHGDRYENATTPFDFTKQIVPRMVMMYHRTLTDMDLMSFLSEAVYDVYAKKDGGKIIKELDDALFKGMTEENAETVNEKKKEIFTKLLGTVQTALDKIEADVIGNWPTISQMKVVQRSDISDKDYTKLWWNSRGEIPVKDGWDKKDTFQVLLNGRSREEILVSPEY